ncbi:unnamed protein product [Rotaria sp. Silwood1]|nr:unnamed protein product [Rotaria sp. Silwood1]CAF3747874.1 unnamed protein product [Rotaria sp. Silwood1]CAF3788209.1 unnamed protein product [Rotaria sp. Silwood1]CAF4716829.1 unnamed protein product [Rotaria sp. Silwood1]CAF4824256.1 unnamed protein product [Rotaria sp. Silwood1]
MLTYIYIGQVYKATWLPKKLLVACKVIKVTPKLSHLEDSFQQELAAYAELSGAYILKIFGYGEDMIGNGIKECYLITELMHRGSLTDVINDKNEKISLRRKLSMACHIVSESKGVYLPPPKQHMNSDLMHQHYDDMMKQFDHIHRLDFHREKDRQLLPHFINTIQYFDDEYFNDLIAKFNAHVMERDRRSARSSPPPKSVHSVSNESHQQFLNIEIPRRSRSRTPSPSPFDDFEHPQDASFFTNFFQLADRNSNFKLRMQRFLGDAGSDRHIVQNFRRMMAKFT